MAKNFRLGIGAAGEQAARKVYESRGYLILAQNFFNRSGKQFGEIDFIATRPGQIRFVEVKTRSSERYGGGLEAVTFQKQRRLRLAVNLFLIKYPKYRAMQPHLDVAIVQIRGFDKRPIKIRIYSDAIDGGNC